MRNVTAAKRPVRDVAILYTHMEQPEIISHVSRLLDPRFDYESNPLHGCPQWEYYWYRKRQRVLKLIRRNTALLVPSRERPWTFADLGCDGGTDLFLIRNEILAKGVQGAFLGIDANPNALKTLQFRKEHFGADDVTCVRSDFTKELPFGDAEVDFVFCSEVVEHLEHPGVLLKEVYRVLKPSGHLLLTTPNEPNIFQRSFWSRARREQLRNEVIAAAIAIGGVTIYGHISLKPYREWRDIVESIGFQEVDYERGAVAYSVGPRAEFTWSLQLLFEGLLDLLPRRLVRGLSDQVIALYRRT
jgi:ubiquinone/menaquinone biosynthesis C-methylase UbiE